MTNEVEETEEIGNEFAALHDAEEAEFSDEVEELPAEGESEVVEEEIPEEIPVEEPDAEPTAPVEETVEEEEEQVPTPVEETVSEEVPSESQQEQQVDMEAIRDHYRGVVNKDDVFEDETSDALANVAADLHMQILQSVQQSMGPTILQTIATQQQQAAYEQEFYGEWPELNAPEHQQAVLRIASAYSQANPQRSPEQAIKEIGAAAMLALGLSREAPAPAPSTAPQAGFKPAAVRTRKASPTTSSNEFVQLADEDDF